MSKSETPTNLDRVVMPAMMLPSFRTYRALKIGVEKKLLFITWGGIGDQICAEPTLRYALEEFKNCEVSLATPLPSLFAHLNFSRVFDTSKGEKPNLDEYLVFQTITPPDESNLVWQFISHCITHCVDFSSICALRCQLPVASREIVLKPKTPSKPELLALASRASDFVVVHAGKHWPSKTFPKDFWDEVLREIIARGKTPVLIGADADDNRSTVDVETKGCLDLRNQMTLTESVWLLQQLPVLLTNDSSPLHMAASGNAWIGFIATCKHPDYITHWRNGAWGWRMKNFGRGGLWDDLDHCPNKEETTTVEFVEETKLRSWLPSPSELAQWAVEKASET